MQAKTRKVISVSAEMRKKLIERHGCSNATVYNALAYKTDSTAARAIRRDALKNFGGVEIKKPVF